MPGLGSLSTMAILLPVTFGMDPVGAVIMLAGIHYGSSYGGSTTAILVNIPGEGSSVMTCMDGYPMAKQGRAKAALATSAIGSFFAGTIAAVLLMFLAEPVSALGMKFGPPEYFAIMFLALTMVGSLSTEAPLKGMFMALVGLFLATVGVERQTGQARFTFGAEDLTDGIHFIVVAIGMFGVTVVMTESERIRKFGFKPPRDRLKRRGLVDHLERAEAVLHGLRPRKLPWLRDGCASRIGWHDGDATRLWRGEAGLQTPRAVR